MPGPLDVLIGEWDVEVPKFGGRGRMRFERLGPYVIQRSSVPDPVPDSIAIIGDGVMRYFDERGVERVYESSVSDGVWTLVRIHPGFSQRFTAAIGGDAFAAKWERGDDGSAWELDFDMRYSRVGG